MSWRVWSHPIVRASIVSPNTAFHAVVINAWPIVYAEIVACGATPFSTTVGELPITVSVGAVTSLGFGQAADALVDAADAALLAAKRAGKNRTVVARRPRPHASAA